MRWSWPWSCSPGVEFDDRECCRLPGPSRREISVLLLLRDAGPGLRSPFNRLPAPGNSLAHLVSRRLCHLEGGAGLDLCSARSALRLGPHRRRVAPGMGRPPACAAAMEAEMLARPGVLGALLPRWRRPASGCCATTATATASVTTGLGPPPPKRCDGLFARLAGSAHPVASHKPVPSQPLRPGGGGRTGGAARGTGPSGGGGRCAGGVLTSLPGPRDQSPSPARSRTRPPPSPPPIKTAAPRPVKSGDAHEPSS